MTRDEKQREEEALDALADLAFLSLRGRKWTDEELEHFMAQEGADANLTEEEIKGTGSFAFENVWSQGSEESATREPETPTAEREILVAMHRGEADISEKALEELERQRREALEEEGDEGEPDRGAEEAAD